MEALARSYLTLAQELQVTGWGPVRWNRPAGGGPPGPARIQAGFPSPAEDYLEEPLDLDRFLIRHPAATFFARVEGDSMIQAGIHSRDLLIIDRSLSPAEGQVVVAVVDGELMVKRLFRPNGRVLLASENPEYAPLEVLPEQDFQIWGVVTYAIHALVS